MVRRDILPNPALFLEKGEAEACGNHGENDDATKIKIATLFDCGSDHCHLVKFVHLIRMIMSGRAWVGVHNRTCPEK